MVRPVEGLLNQNLRGGTSSYQIKNLTLHLQPNPIPSLLLLTVLHLSRTAFLMCTIHYAIVGFLKFKKLHLEAQHWARCTRPLLMSSIYSNCQYMAYTAHQKQHKATVALFSTLILGQKFCLFSLSRATMERS